MKNNRRSFIKDSILQTAGIGLMGSVPTFAAGQPIREMKATGKKQTRFAKGRIKFAVIGMNHGHIYGMANAVKEGGGEMKYFFAKEAELNQAFAKRYPEAKQARSEEEILNDPEVKLVLSAGIPKDRAPLGIRVMKAGKDYMADKPGITTLEQLAEARKVQKETGRIFSIMYSERLGNKATVKASELVYSGAIGRVIQTVGLGPHRMRPESRPDWFFDMEQVGGIITDIASHQFDQFLHFTNSTEAQVLASQVGNFNHKEHAGFEDFGDAMVRGNKGSGYVRVDWFTPDGLDTWGDGRLTVIGTEGFIELRKYTNLATDKGGNNLYLVNQKETIYMNCDDVDLPYGTQIVDDVLNRTETAMTQDHCFLAMELALIAEKNAVQIA
ncbi:Gfo/Idh/MocA family oxidoreductase [Marinilongibacter aquaticus]|uniref:Gfo/Idh/MocA family protein n=1 Tax=Marinilongibacter aquaticus TaxID=2975157 RepID=UPI0021BDA097|nr:Gfo/Idh/MocA family oxidoreductase [Marinilongibacter aquaticus]UBM58390.1 Gfo/Idh/MocA family oxidoreductase [Marinilongibacter aquaticus]